MGRAIEQVMCFAILGAVAFSLQGCSEGAQDHMAQYKAAAAGFVQDAKAGVVTAGLKQSGACPPLHGSVNANKEVVVAKISEKITADVNCNTDLKGAECQKSMAFSIADSTMFTTEEDPMFKVWVGEHSDKWDKIKGSINSVLEGELMGPVKVMQDLIKVGTTTTSEGFGAFLTEQLNQILDGTLAEFCPATEEEKLAAKAADEPMVAQAAKAAKEAGIAKEELFEAEVKAEEEAKEAVAARRLIQI